MKYSILHIQYVVERDETHFRTESDVHDIFSWLHELRTGLKRVENFFDDNGRLRFPYTIDSREKIKIESCAPFSRASTMADDEPRQ